MGGVDALERRQIDPLAARPCRRTRGGHARPLEGKTGGRVITKRRTAIMRIQALHQHRLRVSKRPLMGMPLRRGSVRFQTPAGDEAHPLINVALDATPARSAKSGEASQAHRND
jgi:hypothetical protein